MTTDRTVDSQLHIIAIKYNIVVFSTRYCVFNYFPWWPCLNLWQANLAFTLQAWLRRVSYHERIIPIGTNLLYLWIICDQVVTYYVFLYKWWVTYYVPNTPCQKYIIQINNYILLRIDNSLDYRDLNPGPPDSKLQC